MENSLVFFVNGVKITETHPAPRDNLLRFLRRSLRLTGSKEACGEGRCGACTVMISRYDRREKIVRHMSANACMVPLCSLHNMAVTTVEGIGDTRRGLHKIQECLAEANGIQCGFCTSGMIMSMYTLVRNKANASQEDVLQAIEGNLCRCTGYRSIIDGFTKAVQTTCCRGDETNCPCQSQQAEDNQDQQDASRFRPSDPSQDIIFPPELKLHEEQDRSLTFEHDGITWIRPRDLPHLLLLLAENPEAIIVSGGTTVVLDMKLRGVRPTTLVSTNHIPELTRLEVKNDHVIIGGGLTLEELRTKLPDIIKHLPEWQTRSLTALNKALGMVAACQVRNVASVAGNLLNPATVSDLQPLFLAMDADLHVDSAVIGSRVIPYRETLRSVPPLKALEKSDVLIYVALPLTKQEDHVMFYKQMERGGFNVAYSNAVPFISFEPGSDVVQEFHVTFGGKCFRPVINFQYLNKMKGRHWSLSLIPEVLSCVEKELFPSPQNSSEEMDAKHLAMVHVFRFLYFVEETITGKVVQSAPSPLTKDEYRSSRIFEDVSASQHPDDALRRPIPQFSSRYMTSGEATYLDDIGRDEDELYAGLVLSTRAHAKIVKVDTSKALSLPGVTGYVDHRDVPGKNSWGCQIPGERVFADGKVTCYGQIIGLVVARDRELAIEAAKQVEVEYEDLPSILSIEDAIKEKAFYHEEAGKPDIACGDVDKGFAASDDIIEGHLDIDAREHFYMETHGVLVKPHREHNQIDVYCTTQNPSLTQSFVARVLGIDRNRVICHVKRIGGGFGGKETRPELLNQPIAVAAYKYRRPVRCILDRRTDMTITGKGPAVQFRYKIGYTKDGKIQSLVMDVYVNGGHAADIAAAYQQQIVINAEAAYRYPNIRVTGHLCKTNTPANTAFRGFGFPDAFLVSEVMQDEIARRLNIPKTQVRDVNMFREGDVTVTTMLLENCMLSRCWQQCLQESRYEERRKQVEEFNRKNRWKKRGMSITPYRFGIGYRERKLCQVGALVQVYTDGSVLLAHGGTEMGQGLYIKMMQVASHVLGISISDIHIAETSTNTVPNTPSTAASVSSDLNGLAVKAACEEIQKRLEPIRKQYPDKTWKQLVAEAYLQTISLSAVGFYKSREKGGFEFDTGKGQPFEYMGYGAGCSEVELDCLSGECQILQTDMVIDVGRSLNPAIDFGQIEGAFQQGVGNILMERAAVSSDGCMLKGGPAAYTISTVRDIPSKLNVSLLKDSSNPHGIFSSKGIGEPSICVGTSVYLALKDAIFDCRKDSGIEDNFDLHVPATRQRIREACRSCIQSVVEKKH